jgi:ParB-like chromosome segregation protein Spo0J
MAKKNKSTAETADAVDDLEQRGAARPSPEERVVHVSEIDADFGWNCRLESRTRSEGPSPDTSVDGDPDEPGIEGFAGGLEAVGQEVPAIARLHPLGKAAPRPYSLVVGFRRYSAATWLEEHGRSVKGLAPGQLRVVVHEGLSEVEARRMNVGENVARRNLTTPDLVCGVRELLKVDPGLTGERLATTYGKSQSYMSNVLKVAHKLREGTFKRWRESVVKPLPLVELSRVADEIASKQEEAYQLALDAYDHRRGATDDKAWYRAALRKARDAGTMIGRAEQRGILKLDTQAVLDDEDTELIRMFVRFRTKVGKSRVPQRTVTKVSDAFAEAYVYARDHVEEDEDDGRETEEV